MATLANHALGGAVALAMTQFMKPDALRWTLGVTLIGLAAWVFATESGDDGEDKAMPFGVFGVALFKEVGGTDYIDCVNNAGSDQAAVEQCAQEFTQRVEDEFSITVTPTP